MSHDERPHARTKRRRGGTPGPQTRTPAHVDSNHAGCAGFRDRPMRRWARERLRFERRFGGLRDGRRGRQRRSLVRRRARFGWRGQLRRAGVRWLERRSRRNARDPASSRRFLRAICPRVRRRRLRDGVQRRVLRLRSVSREHCRLQCDTGLSGRARLQRRLRSRPRRRRELSRLRRLHERRRLRIGTLRERGRPKRWRVLEWRDRRALSE